MTTNQAPHALPETVASKWRTLATFLGFSVLEIWVLASGTLKFQRWTDWIIVVGAVFLPFMALWSAAELIADDRLTGATRAVAKAITWILAAPFVLIATILVGWALFALLGWFASIPAWAAVIIILLLLAKHRMIQGKEVGQCRWCGDSHSLVKSHVIAEALFNNANGSGSPMAIAGDASRFVERSQTGIYSRFACRRCEDRFKPHDDYLLAFSKALERGQPVFEGEATLYPDAHLSDHRVFASVKLGRYEAVLARHLASETPGCPTDISVILHVEERPSGANVLSPLRVRWAGGVNGYKLFLPHILALIRLDARQFPGPLPLMELRSDRPVNAARGGRWNEAEKARIRPLMERHADNLERFFAAQEPRG